MLVKNNNRSHQEISKAQVKSFSCRSGIKLAIDLGKQLSSKLQKFVSDLPLNKLQKFVSDLPLNKLQKFVSDLPLNNWQIFLLDASHLLNKIVLENLAFYQYSALQLISQSTLITYVHDKVSKHWGEVEC